MLRFIGLDVHWRWVEACFVDELGRVLQRVRFPCTREQLKRFTAEKLRATDRVALEATTNTWAVVEILQPHVAEVVVSNPLKTRAIAEAKIKTDKVDAEILAQLLRCDYLPRVWIAPLEVQEQRRLLSRRASLQSERVAIKSRLQALLAQKLIEPPIQTLFSKAGMVWLRELDLDDQARQTVESELRLLEGLDAEVAALDEILHQKAAADARVRLLVTLPGVDVIVAEAVLAALGDLSRFPDADHAASYLGLVPSTRQSASRCRHGSITKQGNAYARTMLVQAAQHVIRHPGPLGHCFRKLKRRKHHNVAIIAVARKLVVIAWHCLKNKEPYRYASPRPTATKLARLRIRGGGIIRKRGPAKGSQALAARRAGVRTTTIASLPEIYRREGLPLAKGPEDLSPGERRAVSKSQSRTYYLKIQREQRLVHRREERSWPPSASRRVAKD